MKNGSAEKKTAALILNGDYIEGRLDGEYVLCADGGYNLLKRMGIKCDAVIGDMDSVSGIGADIEVITFNKVKNETDGYLGIIRLCDMDFTRINIYGAFGGRADQVAGNINLLPAAYYSGADAVIYGEDTEVYFTDADIKIDCEKGDIISVLPYTEKVIFKISKGLMYPLEGLKIPHASSQGISNVAIEDTVFISIKKGDAFIYRIK